MQRRIPAAVFICFALTLPPASAMAGEIYKCKDKNGSVTFSDQPCGDNPEIVTIKERGGSWDSGSSATEEPAAETAGSEARTPPRTSATRQKRYYDPVVSTYAPKGSIVKETDYYIEFRDMQSTKEGIDSDRLEHEQGAEYLYYQSAYPTCRSELDEYFARSEASDREIDKKRQEQECTAGQTLEMGFKWHCYVDEAKSKEQGCEVMSCWTHFVCQ